MRKVLVASCVSATLLIFVAAIAFAAVPSYSGTWMLDKSKSGELPRRWQQADSIELDVTQTDKTLSVALKAGPGGDTMIYNLDGSASTADVGGRVPGKATLTAKVNGDGSVELTTVREGNRDGQPMKFTTVEVWSLADGGKTLKMKRSSDSPMGKQESNLVFTKK
jgi:hypothetical protein